MKKNVKFCSGFSIAEMLIALLITMLIATALVPIIGPRKVKNADPRQSHGIAECYWDNDKLMYYYADNKNHKSAGDQIVKNVTSAGYCTFDVPKASSFDIYAISAGAMGSEPDPEMMNELNVVSGTSAKYKGSISMDIKEFSTGETSYQDDLTSNIVKKLGTETNDTLVDGKKFDELVRDSVNRWAAIINQNHRSDEDETILVYEGTGTNVDDGDGELPLAHNPDGQYLYAEFKGLHGPIGAGGGGLSKIFNNDEKNEAEEQCSVLCNPGAKNFPEGCPESQFSIKDAPHYWAEKATLSASALVKNPLDNPGVCKYYHVHEKGGKSAPAAGIAPEASALFPVDAGSIPRLARGKIPYYDPWNVLEGAGTVGASKWPSSVNITGNRYSSEAINNIQIYPSMPGKNATYGKDSSGLGFKLLRGADGVNGIGGYFPGGPVAYAHGSFTKLGPDNVPKVKYLNGTTMKDFESGDITQIDKYSQNGMTFGQSGKYAGPVYPGGNHSQFTVQTIDGEEGWFLAPGIGEYGYFGLTNPLFTWSFNEPTAQITYYSAGKAGNVQHWPFAHLKGTLYLKPGKNNGGDAVSHTYVYTDSSNLAGSTIITVLSPANNDVSGIKESGVFALSDISKGNCLPDSLMSEVIPENIKFEAYKNALGSVRQFGFNKGLLAQCEGLDTNVCLDQNFWPGYGGSGAFPKVVNDEFTYTLTLVNNQAYAQKYNDNDIRKTYIRKLPKKSGVTDSCPDGYSDPNADEDGDDVVHYCTASDDMRRDGAVIIVW